MDNFAAINQRHNTTVGDKFIRHVARIIERHIDGSFMAARTGGGQFGFIFDHTEEGGIFRLCEQVRVAVAMTPLINALNNVSLGHTTLSFGICMQENGVDAAGIVENAMTGDALRPRPAAATAPRSMRRSQPPSRATTGCSTRSERRTGRGSVAAQVSAIVRQMPPGLSTRRSSTTARRNRPGGHRSGHAGQMMVGWAERRTSGFASPKKQSLSRRPEGMPMVTVDFWYSIGSTYSYLSVMRLPDLAEAAGVRFRWRPFDVRHIMVEQDNIPFRDKPVKAAYMWRDIERRAENYGLQPVVPAPYPLRELAFANRVAIVGAEEGWTEAYTRATYRRWFEAGQPAGEEPNLSESLAETGQDPVRVIETARSDRIAGALRTCDLAGNGAWHFRVADLRRGGRDILGRRSG